MFGIPRVYGSRTRVLLLLYFLLGLTLLFLGSILFAGRTAREMEHQASVLTNVFSRFISETAFQADRPGNFAVIQEILREVPFPVILTNADNVPIVWRGVDLPPSVAEDPLELARPDLPPEKKVLRERLDAYLRDFDRRQEPKPILVSGTVQAYVHFGPSALSRRLRWMPWVLLVALIIFMTVGLVGVRSMKRSEQRSIWVGMARETAHQLGTPLTSLLGWLQLLQLQEERPDQGDSPEAREQRRKTFEEMGHDLQRLAKVSARFSKIGASPDLEPIDLRPILEETVHYMRKRTPHLGTPVNIETDLTDMRPVLANRELIEWVLENLLKNAVDAMQNGGHIRVRAQTEEDGKSLVVRVADNGKGIPAAQRQRIWEPGFSTKKRGWGLGLTLVRRIVEEYHGGRIWVEDNPDGEGICFALRLEVADAAEKS